MHCGDQRRQTCRVQQLSPVLGQAEACPEQRSCRGGPKQHDQLGIHQLELRVEPRTARTYVKPGGPRVDATSTAFLETKVFDRVGQPDVATIDTGLGERTIQQLARRPDERRADLVFLVPRLLANEHHPGFHRACPGNPLGGVAVQLTAAAAVDASGE